MYYDNGALPVPTKRQLPQDGFTPSANGLGVPNNPAPGYRPPPTMPPLRKSSQLPMGAVPPQFGSAPPQYGGYMPPHAQLYGGRRHAVLRNGMAMARGPKPQQMRYPMPPQYGGMMPGGMMQGQYPGNPFLNFSPPQYQGNPFLPRVAY